MYNKQLKMEMKDAAFLKLGKPHPSPSKCEICLK